MSNTTIKILTPESPTPTFLHIIKKYDRCVACGNKRILSEYDGFWYCAECLEDEDKLKAIVEYNTNFRKEL